MTNTNTTTLISLFHTEEQAREATQELQNAGIPASSIRKEGGTNVSSPAEFQDLGLPADDLQILTEGVRAGGTVLVVTAAGTVAAKAESIFKSHHAHKVDEKTLQTGSGLAELPAASGAGALAGDVTIPVVEEELVVGKRSIQTGGVRVFSRIIETPVEETVTLTEEHAVIQRRPVDRAATEADFDTLHGESIEILNRDEEVVVSKTASVVEEVVIGKNTIDRAERVTGSVRKTEVSVEQVPTDGLVNDVEENKGRRS